MEQREQTTPLAAQKPTPQQFTREGIMEWLAQKSICGCIDTARLSDLLGTISQRMLRKMAYEGKLKPIDNASNFYVFKVEDVADWLMLYPRYMFKKEVDNTDMTMERVDELSKFIRNYVKNRYPAILKYLDMDDVVMEVLGSICRKRHTDVSDATLVFRALYTLYKKQSKRIDAIPVDPHVLEQAYSGDNDDDEN